MSEASEKSALILRKKKHGKKALMFPLKRKLRSPFVNSVSIIAETQLGLEVEVIGI